MSEVKIENLCKSYGPVDVLKNVDLKVEDGSFVVLVGPSGCGKSTLLRSIAGLEPITSGIINIGGKQVNDLPPAQREIAMVFQSYALYPHKNVYDNMAFGLKFARTPKAEIESSCRSSAHFAIGAPVKTPPARAFRRPTPARCHWPGDRTQTTSFSF